MGKVWQSEIKLPWKSFSSYFKKFPQTKLITTNSSCTKVKKFSPITPERRGIYYSIAITIHIPVTADNFPLSSFSWVCFFLESCWRFNINRNKFLRMLNNFVFPEWQWIVQLVLILVLFHQDNFSIFLKPNSFLYNLLFRSNCWWQ